MVMNKEGPVVNIFTFKSKKWAYISVDGTDILLMPLAHHKEQGLSPCSWPTGAEFVLHFSVYVVNAFNAVVILKYYISNATTAQKSAYI